MGNAASAIPLFADIKTLLPVQSGVVASRDFRYNAALTRPIKSRLKQGRPKDWTLIVPSDISGVKAR